MSTILEVIRGAADQEAVLGGECHAAFLLRCFSSDQAMLVARENAAA
jgi:hypothetical protein